MAFLKACGLAIRTFDSISLVSCILLTEHACYITKQQPLSLSPAWGGSRARGAGCRAWHVLIMSASVSSLLPVYSRYSRLSRLCLPSSNIFSHSPAVGGGHISAHRGQHLLKQMHPELFGLTSCCIGEMKGWLCKLVRLEEATRREHNKYHLWDVHTTSYTVNTMSMLIGDFRFRLSEHMIVWYSILMQRSSSPPFILDLCSGDVSFSMMAASTLKSLSSRAGSNLNPFSAHTDKSPS